MPLQVITADDVFLLLDVFGSSMIATPTVHCAIRPDDVHRLHAILFPATKTKDALVAHYAQMARIANSNLN